MIQAALNGGRPRRFHPRLPCTPTELAREAFGAVGAGAACLHIHPRAADDTESLAAPVIAQALEAVRAAVPGTPVGVSTGRWIAPGGAARHDCIRAWTVLPDYVSVNIIEEDSADVISLAVARGIGVEAGVWSPADVERFSEHPDAGRCLRILVEINEQSVSEALRVLDLTLMRIDTLGLKLPLLVHGLDKAFWPLHRAATSAGFDTRAGLEDGALLPTGAVAPDNAALIAAARTFVQDQAA